MPWKKQRIASEDGDEQDKKRAPSCSSSFSTTRSTGNETQEKQAEELASALQSVLNAILNTGLYPAQVGSLWMFVRSCPPKKPSLTANFLPVLEGATREASADATDKYTREYKLFERTFVDESDGCYETSVAFSSLDDKYEDPSKAVRPFLSSHCMPRQLAPADRVEELGDIWERWMLGIKWCDLRGAFVRALEADSISRRLFESDEKAGKMVQDNSGRLEKLLNVRPYHRVHPHDPDFMETLGYQKEGPGVKEYNDSFVCVWDKKDGIAPCLAREEASQDGGEIDEDLCLELVRVAIEKAVARDEEFARLKRQDKERQQLS